MPVDNTITPKDCVSRLVPYSPGKPIAEVQREYGLTDIDKMASNENPLGPSPRAIAAITKAVGAIHHYPDATSHDLRHALAEKRGLPVESVIVGNGGDELIQLLGITFLRPGDRMIMSLPSFVRYEAAGILNEAEVVKVPVRDFKEDLDAVADRINDRTRIVFVNNPNNPTGTINTRDAVTRLLDRIPPGTLVMLDEAYAEFVEDPDYPNSVDYVKEGRNVIVLHTFSKIYGLAGVRLGYCLARPDIIDNMNRVREPFNVNVLAQVAGIAALDDDDHVRNTLKVNSEGKRYLEREFERLGLPYAKAEANFILVDVLRECRPVYEGLLRKGVIVRTGDIFGMPTCLRVSIGTPPMNERFIRELQAILKG